MYDLPSHIWTLVLAGVIGMPAATAVIAASAAAKAEQAPSPS